MTCFDISPARQLDIISFEGFGIPSPTRQPATLYTKTYVQNGMLAEVDLEPTLRHGVLLT